MTKLIGIALLFAGMWSLALAQINCYPYEKYNPNNPTCTVAPEIDPRSAGSARCSLQVLV